MHLNFFFWLQYYHDVIIMWETGTQGWSLIRWHGYCTYETCSLPLKTLSPFFYCTLHCFSFSNYYSLLKVFWRNTSSLIYNISKYNVELHLYKPIGFNLNETINNLDLHIYHQYVYIQSTYFKFPLPRSPSLFCSKLWQSMCILSSTLAIFIFYLSYFLFSLIQK